jgi:hypothetical protein
MNVCEYLEFPRESKFLYFHFIRWPSGGERRGARDPGLANFRIRRRLAGDNAGRDAGNIIRGVSVSASG